MEQNSYPQPPPFTWNKYHVRDPLPIYPPTLGTFDSTPPILPSPPRKPAFDAPFTLTTHLFPASYLRTTRPIPLPKLPDAGATKEERRRMLSESSLQLLDWGNDTSATDGYPLVLWNCVNRYVKKGLDLSNKTGMTLFFAHANGFPKEVSYECGIFWGYYLHIDLFCVRRFGSQQLVVYFVHLLLES